MVIGGTQQQPIVGDDYIVEYLTSDLRRRVQIYENNTMTNQLLENIQ